MIRPTTFIDSIRLTRYLRQDVLLASETFQHTGSFKFRATYHLASNIPNRHVLAASSGNFGQAIAYSCQLLGKRCTVVMPDNSAQVKIDAVREFGATVCLIDTRKISRKEKVNQLSRELEDVYVASSYDDDLVIAGNSTLGRELAALEGKVSTVVVPIGGGGLASGIITGLRESASTIKVVGAEPLLANDAARSLKAGKLICDTAEARTIADGARTLGLGQRNWEILKTAIPGIVEIPEDNIKEAVRLLYRFANLKVEPTGALGLAALLTEPERFRGKAVCCVVSGGNVDAEVYRSILAEGH
jgi:threonine dehydratase